MDNSIFEIINDSKEYMLFEKNKSELEKLVLYASSEERSSPDINVHITLDTVIESSGDAGVWSLDQIAESVANGEMVKKKLIKQRSKL